MHLQGLDELQFLVGARVGIYSGFLLCHGSHPYPKAQDVFESGVLNTFES